VVLNHDCEDFLSIELPRSRDVDSKIVHGKPHVSDHASLDIAQVGPVFCHWVGVRRHVAVWVVVISDRVIHATGVIVIAGALVSPGSSFSACDGSQATCIEMTWAG
jgi:hypothetical protein